MAFEWLATIGWKLHCFEEAAALEEMELLAEMLSGVS